MALSAVLDTVMTARELSDIFRPHDFIGRLKKIYDFYDVKDVLVTSSFGTRSAFLLHLISEINPDQKIHFVDTGYHFKETIEYKEKLTKEFSLNVIDVFPDEFQHSLTTEESWWIDHPKMCCTINKISPLEPVIANHRLWIAGLMGWQTSFRSRLDIFSQQGDILKFHPFIDLAEGDFLFYQSKNKLPAHPLQAQGYGSVGCKHCTKKGEGRSGRWQSSGQTECGLHPNYFLKNRHKKS